MLSNWFRNTSQRFGAPVVGLMEAVGKVSLLIQQTGQWLTSARRSDTLAQMLEIGVRSFPVTALTSLFTGMVLALQTGYSFRKVFNEPLYVGTVVGLSLTKELGPVLTSIVISGRVGAAIAAEIGTMKVTEQLDALYTLGTNPVRYLAVPRFIACCLMVPLLTVWSDVIGILGGLMIATNRLGVPSSRYLDEIKAISWKEPAHGLIKAAFFGLIIVTISCYKGFQCEGGAEGVGKATTSAVVIAMVLILVFDYFLSAFLVSFGIG